MSKMTLKKRLAAAAAAVCMTFSLSACANDTAYVMTANGGEIAAGVYINLMLNELTNQMYNLYLSGTEITGSYMDQEVDGVKMNEYLENYAYDMCKKIAAVELRCEELGVELSDEQLEEVNDSVNAAWDANGDYYHTMGISKDSLRRVEKYYYLSENLFDKYYGEGGIEEVTPEQMTEYVNENLLRFKALTIEKDSEDEGEAAKENADKYLEIYEDEGLTMDELIERYEADMEAQEDEDADDDSSSDDSSSDDSSSDDSSSDDSSSDDSSSDDSSSDDSSSDDSSSDDSSSDDSSSDDSSSDDSSTDDSSSDDSSSEDDADSEEEKTEAELEAEQYPNEYVSNKDGSEDDMVAFIDEMEIGAVEIYEDDYAYYIVQKLDMSERTTYVEPNRETLLTNMRSEDFEKVVSDLADALQIVDNKKALERYNALDVYERQTEKASD